MTDEEIKSQVDLKGEEIKRQVAESRLEFYLKLGAFLGVVIPLTLAIFSTIRVDSNVKDMREEIQKVKSDMESKLQQTIASTEGKLSQSTSQMNSKVDNSITSMNKSFTELAKNQRRKPELVATFKDGDLNGAIIPVKQNEENRTLKIMNIGDATAKNVRAFLYTNHPDCIYFNPTELNYGPAKYNELSGKYTGCLNANLGDLDPKEPILLPIGMNLCENKILIDTVELIIRCGEQSPKKYNFLIQLQQ
jgi:hypothetical protein